MKQTKSTGIVNVSVGIKTKGIAMDVSMQTTSNVSLTLHSESKNNILDADSGNQEIESEINTSMVSSSIGSLSEMSHADHVEPPTQQQIISNISANASTQVPSVL